MGCGESKHVATENTISRKSSRAGSRRGKAVEERSKHGDNAAAGSLVQEEGKIVNQQSGETTGLKKEGNHDHVVEKNEESVVHLQGIGFEAKIDKQECEGKSKELKKEGNGESIDQSIAVGGMSAKSEIFSPRGDAGVGNESSFEVNDMAAKETNAETKEETVEVKDKTEETKKETVEETKPVKETKEGTVEETKPVEEAKEETVEETKPVEEATQKAVEEAKPVEETKEETVEDKQLLSEEKTEETVNGEPETVKEENLVNEAETAETTTEAEVSTPVEKVEEKPAASPAEDLKTE